MNTQSSDTVRDASAARGVSRVGCLAGAVIIELIAAASMSASLAVANALLLALAALCNTAAVALPSFEGRVTRRVGELSCLLGSALVALCALQLALTKNSGTSSALLAVYVALAVVAVIRLCRGRRELSHGARYTLCAATTVASLLLYAVHGEGVGLPEAGLILLCHAVALLVWLLHLLRLGRPWRTVTAAAVAVLCPATSFLLLEALTHNAFADISLPIFLANLFLFYAFAATTLFAFGRSTPALLLTVLFPLCFGLVSYFTVKFRGTPLFPWDLASYGIAATVLGGYDLTVTPAVALVCSCATALCTLSCAFRIQIKFKGAVTVRIVAALLSAGLLLAGGAYLQTDEAVERLDLYPHLFVPHHLYKMNGFAVSFIMNLRYTSVERPEGYDSESVNAIAGSYSSDSVADAETTPNVIVIMNESFADMKALCDFEATAEYLPYISSLDENTQKGILHSSVVGGNTPNSEFEFLTGMTMGFLPSGSVAYQQFLKDARPSLVSQLSSLGYHTVAMHPYWAEGWKRESVYPMLGFDELHFLDYEKYGSFNDYPLLREYVSDAGVYRKIRLAYEAKADGEPLFVFAVTMQNHGGYDQRYDNFTPSVGVVGLEDNFELSTYMSLIRESDSAFGELVEYFKGADEPTVILMFGDHQPNDSVAEVLLDAAGASYSDSDIAASEARYKVPYIIWANYSLADTESHELSINYLSSLLASSAGLPMTAAQKYALELSGEYPVINSRCIIDSAGELCPVSDFESIQKLREYSYLQYAYLFDGENLPQTFWTLAGE